MLDSLTAKTSILLIDDLHTAPSTLVSPDSGHHTDPFAANKPLHLARRIDLAATVGLSRRAIRDTLPEEIYSKAHRKAERHEKQLRNIEKERAQHENVQLHRLLEELKGPDWLKVIGISGVTESEKKLYEPKRIYFVREVAALIAKFRHWKEEEKRRKQEREHMSPAEDVEDSESEPDEDGQSGDDVESGDGSRGDDGEGFENGHRDGHFSRSPTSISPAGRPGPDTSEVDAAAARQLHQEAIGASPTSQQRRTRVPSEKFNHRQDYPSISNLIFASGQTASYKSTHSKGPSIAFGQPLPSPEERDFQLPDEILTRQTLVGRARERRRLKRGVSE